MNDLTHRNRHMYTLADNAVIARQKSLYRLYITSKIECFSFKSGCATWVAELFKRDWFIVLLRKLWVKTTLYHTEIRIIYLIVNLNNTKYKIVSKPPN